MNATRDTDRSVSPAASLLAMLVLVVGALSAPCTDTQANTTAMCETVPDVVTDDIKVGIEKHIADRVRLGNGFYRMPFGDKELQLKLVRVHIEYLSNLGPRRHFACVDMVCADGEFYDVDFFLAGDPGAMTVTETRVHKLNGRPFYLWKQSADQTGFARRLKGRPGASGRADQPGCLRVSLPSHASDHHGVAEHGFRWPGRMISRRFK